MQPSPPWELNGCSVCQEDSRQFFNQAVHYQCSKHPVNIPTLQFTPVHNNTSYYYNIFNIYILFIIMCLTQENIAWKKMNHEVAHMLIQKKCVLQKQIYVGEVLNHEVALRVNRDKMSLYIYIYIYIYTYIWEKNGNTKRLLCKYRQNV
jgi:hypothetical protein